MSRGRAVRVLLLCAAAAVFVSLVMLGNWQLHRLAWKTELIDAVEERAFADPVPVSELASEPARRDGGDPARQSYRRVTIKGRFLHQHTRFVKAVTEIGAGFWVLTPLDAGLRRVWINRGFIPSERRADARFSKPAGRTGIVGLIRVTEPGGTLLQGNDPTAGRWYSRDVAALSRDADIDAQSGWFIDAAQGTAASAARWPRAGLTRLEFRNPHLAYALTWYAMALALACGIGYVVYLERRQHSSAAG